MKKQIDLVTAAQIEKWGVTTKIKEHEKKLRELRLENQALDLLIFSRQQRGKVDEIQP
tara:strand:- start:2415 stop:2588 length:174 start_codon:yes stop_codon:yes gene_type:complete